MARAAAASLALLLLAAAAAPTAMAGLLDISLGGGGGSSKSPPPPPSLVSVSLGGDGGGGGGGTGSPPPPLVTVTVGVKGDPHFSGADGVHFDFTGVPGATYCMFSDRKVHVNMHMAGYTAGEETHTWITKVGILSGSHSLVLAAREGAEAARGDGYLASVELDGVAHKLALTEERKSEDGAVSVHWTGHGPDGDDDVDSIIVSIPTVARLLLKLRPEVPSLRTSENAYVHFSVEVLEAHFSRSVHGVLGQTFGNALVPSKAPAGYEMEYSELLWVWQVAGTDATGYLQGTPESYKSSGLLAADCKFARFESASGLKSLRPGAYNRKVLQQAVLAGNA